MNLKDDASIWYGHNHGEMKIVSDEGIEKLFLDSRSHAKKKDNEIYRGLFSCNNSILQIHECI